MLASRQGTILPSNHMVPSRSAKDIDCSRHFLAGRVPAFRKDWIIAKPRLWRQRSQDRLEHGAHSAHGIPGIRFQPRANLLPVDLRTEDTDPYWFHSLELQVDNGVDDCLRHH